MFIISWVEYLVVLNNYDLIIQIQFFTFIILKLNNFRFDSTLLQFVMFVNLIVSFLYLYYFVLGSLVALAQHCWVVCGHSVGVLGIIIFFEIDFDCVELLIVFLEWYLFLVCYETCPFEMEIFYFSFFGFFLVGLIE